MFQKAEDGSYGRLGDIIKDAKNNTDSGINKLNFTLLGDPAIKFPIPEELVLIDSVNSTDVSKNIDTLRAYQEVVLTGRVTDIDSNIYSDFNGVVNLNVFDKEVEMTTRSNHGLDTIAYTVQKNIIYKGKATVKNGRFSTKFRVPKDISYNFGIGKIAMFAQDSTTIASGYSKNIIVGGTADNNFSDDTGPEIKLFLNDTNFVDGGICGASPYIYAKIYDESGINTTGLGIGHDITAYLYENDKKYYITEFFESDLDDYRKGVVQYQIKNLEEGTYNLELKVWDINNNSSEAFISFNVVDDEQIFISNLQNYPNPASKYTEFHYEHNMPETEHNICIDVFDLSGRLVHRITRSNYEQGFVAEPIQWDIGASGLARGVYPYRLTVTTTDGKKAYFNQKLIIIE